MKKICVIILLSLSALCVNAQTVFWAISPGTYESIEEYGKGIYLVSKSNNYGIVNEEGKVVVPVEATRITRFYEGTALVLVSERGKERVAGILTDDGHYTTVSEIYFTIQYQDFFSEGLLSVTTSRGKLAYIDEYGNKVLEFNTNTGTVFTEGYATIGSGNSFSIIDRSGSQIQIKLGVIGNVQGGTNVYKGQAYVWDGNGKFYIMDAQSGVCRGTSKPRLDLDYLYCFSSVTQRPATVPYDNVKSLPATLNKAKSNINGLYGFADGSDVVIPCQFSNVESFHGKAAIVTIDGRKGLINYSTSENFELSAANSKISYTEGAGTLKHKAILNVPSMWKSKDISITTRNSSGDLIDSDYNNGNISFSTSELTGEKDYTIEVKADGLTLWSGKVNYTYERKRKPVVAPVYDNSGHNDNNVAATKPLEVKLFMLNTNADKNNHCNVQAEIHNPNNKSVTATVTIVGSNLLESKHTQITVPANGTKTVTTFFTVRKASRGQSVTASTSAGGSVTLNGLQLIPF